MRAKALGPWCVPVGVLKERKAGQCSWWEPVEKRTAMGQARSQGPFVQGLPWGSLGERQVLLNGGRKKSRIGCGMGYSWRGRGAGLAWREGWSDCGLDGSGTGRVYHLV